MRQLSIAALAGALSCLSAPIAAQDLPAGDSRDLVEAICTACHQPNQILRSSGYTVEGWRELAATMVDLSEAPAERNAIIAYLAANFPPHEKRAPKLIAGPSRVAFTEWQVPTLGQRARDPVQAPDGSIWWAGQFGNLVGRIDPASGAMTEYPLPDKAMPHSVTLDAAGMVWYTGNKNGTVGRLDPATGAVTEFPMPDPAARDPHTHVFDANGIMWFTLQQSNMIGRLDPASGDVRRVATAPGAKPYGIKIDAAGTPWVACNGSNCLIRVDPESMALTEVKLPIPATTVRRLDIASDGMIWYVNSSQGRLGRYDPKSGDIREWPSPSGPKSHPYAIAVVDGIVWYNESGMRPDALVRFDPATENFQSWAIPSGGVYAGIIRHMRPTRDGNLLIHQSSTNRIIRVDLKAAVTQ
ncbi:MAG: cytochrome C [Proteobacteria bacterium]|nr:cytochrome C [Pseudomonadota bacterium]